MKVLNFTAIEVLPGLLDKTKDQSCRPAYKIITHKDLHNWENSGKTDGEFIKKYGDSFRIAKDIIGEKKPRFKIGEEIRLEWKSRTSPKDSWFCSHCGMRSEIASATNGKTFMGCPQSNMQTIQAFAFPKVLGQGKITEVFKIEMFYVAGFPTLRAVGMPLNDEFMSDLAKRDGFNCVRNMWNWFDKRYDLDKIEHREFWVYRWEYI